MINFEMATVFFMVLVQQHRATILCSLFFVYILFLEQVHLSTVQIFIASAGRGEKGGAVGFLFWVIVVIGLFGVQRTETDIISMISLGWPAKRKKKSPTTLRYQALQEENLKSKTF